MNRPVLIDADWRRRNPLPSVTVGGDKNERGRVLLVGGSRFVPGALRLTGEAALRMGAGKLQLATIAAAALHLGIAVPEAAVIELPTNPDGEIAADAGQQLVDALSHADTLILGPAMSACDDVPPLMRELLHHPRDDLSILLDAAAASSARGLEKVLSRHGGRVVLTPHCGEMASLMELEKKAVEQDQTAIAAQAATRFGAIVVLKSVRTVIAAPDGTLLEYHSDTPGLGTGGSGDVLAGVIGGLMARGADPLVAAAWGVWLHGEAGRAAAHHCGPVGFLARELPALLPRL
ncbi:MAG: hypothetical protein JWO65_1723, partial [Sphingomonas bacterium]|nr:hypothetical protein [Sphingomonas bacterium]